MAKITENDGLKSMPSENIHYYSTWAIFSPPQTKTSFKCTFETFRGNKQGAEAEKSIIGKNSGSTKLKCWYVDLRWPPVSLIVYARTGIMIIYYVIGVRDDDSGLGSLRHILKL